MDITQGSVVIAKAGRDKGKMFAVIKLTDDRSALIADGRSRPIERPKRKNLRHLQATSRRVDCITTNRQLHDFLKKLLNGG